MGNARRFAGGTFIKIEQLKGQPPVQERIEFVTEEDGKFGPRLVLTFESGQRLSLNATSVGNLIRDIDQDFDNWAGHDVSIRADQVDFQNGKADAILVELASETPTPAPARPKPPTRETPLAADEYIDKDSAIKKKPQRQPPTETPLPAAKKADMDDEIPF
jgi:hypothetical protein